MSNVHGFSDDTDDNDRRPRGRAMDQSMQYMGILTIFFIILTIISHRYTN